MTLLEVNPGDSFSIRTIKRYNEKRWANVYEVTYLGNSPMADPVSKMTQVLTFIANTEADLLLTPYTVERATLSTLAVDSKPYNPDTFISLGVELTGRRQIPLGQKPLPLTTCILVKKRVPTGRQGNLLYRGLIHTGDGSLGVAGFQVLDQVASSIENRLTQVRAFLLDQYTLGLCLVALKPDGQPTQPRLVTALEVRQLTTVKKLNNKYFNRSSSSQGGGPNV